MSNYENMTTFCLFLLCQFHINEYDDDRCHNFRQNVAGKTCSDTTSGTNTRSKPLETKRSSSNKPLQKVAPHYVKKVVAEVVSSAEQIEVKYTVSAVQFATRCFLHEFLVKLDSQLQFWNLLVRRLLKRPLHV